MLDQTQAPQVVFPPEKAWQAVRMYQLKTPQDQPFSMDFLNWLYVEYLEYVSQQLKSREREMVDTLMMFHILLDRTEQGKTTGADVENLFDVLGQVTKRLKW